MRCGAVSGGCKAMITLGEWRGRERRHPAELLCGVPRAVWILAAALPGALSRASILAGAVAGGW